MQKTFNTLNEIINNATSETSLEKHFTLLKIRETIHNQLVEIFYSTKFPENSNVSIKFCRVEVKKDIMKNKKYMILLIELNINKEIKTEEIVLFEITNQLLFHRTEQHIYSYLIRYPEFDITMQEIINIPLSDSVYTFAN